MIYGICSGNSVTFLFFFFLYIIRKASHRTLDILLRKDEGYGKVYSFN